MKVLFVILLIAFVGLCKSQKQLGQDIVYEDPKFPGKCVTKDHTGKQLVMDVLETRPSPAGRCFNLKCEKEEDHYLVSKFDCEPLAKQQGCKLVENREALYPNCCKTFDCS